LSIVPSWNTIICSTPLPSIPEIFNNKNVVIVGEMQGSVMLTIHLSLPAPSIFAAS